ncbi:MAG: glycosyltransferase family 4 protein [Candidatus Woesearchaeota archaeon]
MKLAYLAPEFYPPWGGVGIYSMNLVNELSKKIQIDVFTPKRTHEAKYVEKEFGNRIRVINIGTAKNDFSYNLFFQYRLLKEFPRYNNVERYDVVHSANLVHMPDVFLKLRGYKMNSVVTAHTTIKGQVSGTLKSSKNFFKMAPSEKGSLIAYPYIRTLEAMYLKKTKYMITVSKKFEEMFRQKGYNGFLKTIHNGVDIAFFKRVSNANNFPQLNDKGFIVLFAGRLISLKGTEDFVKMMASLRDLDIHFVVAGQGDVDGFKRLLVKYQIPKEKYTFLGFVNNRELPEVYRKSSIFVLPSYTENLPISLLEAMSLGCCCIATDVGAISEIIESGKEGFLFKPGNVNELAGKVRLLYNNKKLRAKLAKNGYNKVLKEFSVRKMAAETLGVYRRMQDESF